MTPVRPVIFDTLAAEQHVFTELATHAFPLPASTGSSDGEDDHLIVRTDNGLRADDAALPQPPQHPGWTP